MERPGAFHHARFMAKAIYLCKMALTLHQLPADAVSPNEAQEVKRMAVFIAIHYAMYWLQTPLTVQAPRLDLEFWKAMTDFEVFTTLKLPFTKGQDYQLIILIQLHIHDFRSFVHM